jgi:hypothetical protein
MHPLSSEVVKVCLPGGQRKPFRHNMMALMTITGAKGSVVNFSQVSWCVVCLCACMWIGWLWVWACYPQQE